MHIHVSLEGINIWMSDAVGPGLKMCPEGIVQRAGSTAVERPQCLNLEISDYSGILGNIRDGFSDGWCHHFSLHPHQGLSIMLRTVVDIVEGATLMSAANSLKGLSGSALKALLMSVLCKNSRFSLSLNMPSLTRPFMA